MNHQTRWPSCCSQRLVDVHDLLRRTRSRNAKRDAVAELLGEADAGRGPAAWRRTSRGACGSVASASAGEGWREPPPTGRRAGADPDRGRRGLRGDRRGGGHRLADRARRRRWSGCCHAPPSRSRAYLRALALGEVRQGALDSVLLDAVAAAAGCRRPRCGGRRCSPPTRERSPSRRSPAAGPRWRRSGWSRAGRCGRCWPPAHRTWARRSRPSPVPGGCYVDRKLDGVRLQVHRVGDEVTIYTRSLDDITERLPGVVAAVRGLGAERVVLDGEVLLVADGRPRPFQETASAVGRTGALADDLRVSWFDLLHLDGADLVGPPARRAAGRARRAGAGRPGRQRVHRLAPADAEQAAEPRRSSTRRCRRATRASWSRTPRRRTPRAAGAAPG